MSEASGKIPFAVEISRVIEVLAAPDLSNTVRLVTGERPEFL